MGVEEKILVVDDSRTVREALRLMLEPEGYQVVLAGTLAEARACIDAQKPDLIFIDRQLESDDDGFEVARIARESLPHVARLIMTGDHSLETAIRAMEEDIFGYLTKPLQKPAVLIKLRRALDRAKLRRERAEALEALEVANAGLAERAAQLEKMLGRLVAAQSQLVESEKLASLGALAAGVAHEVNNPACFIAPNLEYLRRTIDKVVVLGQEAGVDSDALKEEQGHGHRMLDRCAEGVSRIAEVVRMLQLFSQREHGERGTFELGDLCRSLVDLVRHELDGMAELELDFQPDVWVEGCQQDLAQAVLNLLLNARRSLSEGRPVHPAIGLSVALEGQRARVRVTDNGAPLGGGEDCERALELFDAGGALDRGHGLMLSVVRDIAVRHGGRLDVRCSDERNLLQLYVPVAGESAPR